MHEVAGHARDPEGVNASVPGLTVSRYYRSGSKFFNSLI
jgi:hypothetical protein